MKTVEWFQSLIVQPEKKERVKMMTYTINVATVSALMFLAIVNSLFQELLKLGNFSGVKAITLCFECVY